MCHPQNRASFGGRSRGDGYDNALAEASTGLYKTELIHRHAPWKTREALELCDKLPRDRSLRRASSQRLETRLALAEQDVPLVLNQKAGRCLPSRLKPR